MKEAFIDWEPKTKYTKALLGAAIQVVNEYIAQGYVLTLRQLYYQLVSRDLIPNQQTWYKRLGDVVSQGRMAGYIDWSSIVDRGRAPVTPPEWDSPAQIVNACAEQYRLDRWEGQEYYVEVWCEKDALASVIEPVCNRNHVRFLACRGYASSTAIYDASKRLLRASRMGRTPVVIYLGDHDPSGIDMTRDVDNRLDIMLQTTEIRRIALNYDQITQYNPPPNPTKLTDSRADMYIAQFGYESWELDALEPAVLDDLVESAIQDLLDAELYDARLDVEDSHKGLIGVAAERIEEELADQEDES